MANQTALTVEEALKELREMFPDVFVEAQTGHWASYHPLDPYADEQRKSGYNYALVTVDEKQIRCVTLDEAMEQVRQWGQSQ